MPYQRKGIGEVSRTGKPSRNEVHVMSGYAGEEYEHCKKWIAQEIQDGYSWEQVAHLCVDAQDEEDEFDRLQNDELIIPETMEFDEWPQFVKDVQSNYSKIS